LQARIERLSPVLVEKPYYLVFSHRFYQAHPLQSRQVWDAIEQVRDSAAYQRYATSLRSTPPVGE
jgi:polar amino acid transport system substrate-binding protein